VGGIKIRFKGFETHTREKALVSHTDSEAALVGTVDSLLEEFEREGRPVRLVGVRVAGLIRMTAESRRLDEWSD
jgi:DNA polymerase-4